MVLGVYLVGKVDLRGLETEAKPHMSFFKSLLTVLDIFGLEEFFVDEMQEMKY